MRVTSLVPIRLPALSSMFPTTFSHGFDVYLASVAYLILRVEVFVESGLCCHILLFFLRDLSESVVMPFP